MDHERALAMFAKYKEATYRKDPEADLRSREVEFINALGTVYTKLFNMERKDTAWFEMAVGSYRLVLEELTACGLDLQNARDLIVRIDPLDVVHPAVVV